MVDLQLKKMSNKVKTDNGEDSDGEDVEAAAEMNGNEGMALVKVE